MSDEKKEIIKTKEKALKVTQYALTGENKGEITVSKEIFDIIVPSVLIAQYVRMYQTNQRQGTASTKTRAEVAGTTKKIYKQKGTGKARHGSMRAPIFKGGGVVGGPKPKSYHLDMSKKQKKLSLFGSLTIKLKQGNIILLAEEVATISAKTKDIATFIDKMKYNDETALFVVPKNGSGNVALAIRNLVNASSVLVNSLNPYEVLNATKIIFVGNSISELENHFLKKNED